MNLSLRSCIVAIALIAAASPAAAQWTRVTALPATDVFSIWSSGDTIVAGMDTVVYVSINAGASWKRSAKVPAGVTENLAVLMRNGRIYAGSRGQGVFVSDDLGDSWLGFNQGLVGGIFDTQLDIRALMARGDSLYAATGGAGVWVRNLAGVGTWSHYGELPGDNTSGTVDDVAASDTRLVACASANGSIYSRDRGGPQWTQGFLEGGFHAGLEPQAAAWTGHGWVVGSNGGLFRSDSGLGPWTPTLQIVPTFLVSFALRGRDLFAQVGNGSGTLIEFSGDDGATWQELENQSRVFTYKIAINGSELYAARLDGLWHRSTATTSVADVPAGGLRFSIAGPQPVGDDVHFQFVLPEPGPASIEVFDAAGRRASSRLQGSWSVGLHEVSWSARDLGPGVYLARLHTGVGQRVVRLIRVR